MNAEVEMKGVKDYHFTYILITKYEFNRKVKVRPPAVLFLK